MSDSSEICRNGREWVENSAVAAEYTSRRVRRQFMAAHLSLVELV